MRFASAVLAACLAGAAAQQTPPVRVEVKTLPGYNQPLPSRIYSGHVNVGTPPSGKGEMYFHYVAIESENNPATAPTVFWYNGGPGASSLFGIFGELGPYYLDVRSELTAGYNATKLPTPFYNPFTWTKKFNVLAIDSPAPVGFSFCTEKGPSGDGYSCGPWKDTDVFKANHIAVKKIMDAFPEWKKNDLYITGESYAGVYIPGLINEMLDDPNLGLNLKGFAVGDGCMGTETVCWDLAAAPGQYPSTWQGPYYDVRFFGGHGQISNELYDRIMKECPEEGLRNNNLDAKCRGYIKEMWDGLGGFFVYDLYDDCPTHMLAKRSGMLKEHTMRMLRQAKVQGALNDYPCPGTALDDWLNRTEFRTAFSLPANSYFFNADNGAGFDYTSNVKDVRDIYVKAAKRGLRILTYEGDADACGLSSFGLQDIYRELWPASGYPLLENWRPWTTDGSRMGGYAMQWGQNRKAQIFHLTVRGSGHLVPLNKPAQAYSMIDNFVFGKPFPGFDGN